MFKLTFHNFTVTAPHTCSIVSRLTVAVLKRAGCKFDEINLTLQTVVFSY